MTATPTPLPDVGKEDWRAELALLVESHGKGHCIGPDGAHVEGAYEAWERARILLSRDSNGVLRL